jgi:hypothetical protein
VTPYAILCDTLFASTAAVALYAIVDALWPAIAHAIRPGLTIIRTATVLLFERERA